MRRWLVSLALLAVLTAAIVAALAFFMLESPRTVYALRLEPTSFARQIVGFGQTGSRRILLSFARQGAVKEVRVQPGDHVEKGELLARLDDEALQRRLDLARDRLALARADARQSQIRLQSHIAQTRDALERAQTELRIKKELLAAGAASAAEVRRAEERVAQLQQQLDYQRTSLSADEASRKARIKALETEVAAAQLALEQARLVAPEAGVVETVTLAEGQGARGTIVLRLPGESTLEARFSSDDGALLRPGQPAHLSFETWPPMEADTKVARVLPRERGADWVTVQFAAVETPPHPQTSFTARATVETLTDVLVVPKLALVEEGERRFVWTVHLGRARKVPVRVLAENPDAYAVSGLEAGVTILNLPPSDLKDGERVRTIEAPP